MTKIRQGEMYTTVAIAHGVFARKRDWVPEASSLPLPLGLARGLSSSELELMMTEVFD